MVTKNAVFMRSVAFRKRLKMKIKGRVFHGNILPLLWTFTPEFGTIVVVSLYTNEEILCTGRIKTIG